MNNASLDWVVRFHLFIYHSVVDHITLNHNLRSFRYVLIFFTVAFSLLISANTNTFLTPWPHIFTLAMSVTLLSSSYLKK